MDTTRNNTSKVLAHVAGTAAAVVVIAAWQYYSPIGAAVAQTEVKGMTALAVVAYVAAYHLFTPSRTA
jgi:hypothetical protein